MLCDVYDVELVVVKRLLVLDADEVQCAGSGYENATVSRPHAVKNLFSIPICISVLVSSVWANTVSFRETYADRIVTTREDRFVSYDQIATGSFTARGKLILTAEDLDGITVDENTVISVIAGGWSFEASLGDDPKFVPGKKSARFVINGGVVTIALAIGRSSTTVTWSIRAKTGISPLGDEFQASPAAAELGDGENATITLEDELKVACEVSLADITAYSEVPLSGAVRYNVRTVGSGEDANELELKSCAVRGSGVMMQAAF
jgi:hypothetical protein